MILNPSIYIYIYMDFYIYIYIYTTYTTSNKWALRIYRIVGTTCLACHPANTLLGSVPNMFQCACHLVSLVSTSTAQLDLAANLGWGV